MLRGGECSCAKGISDQESENLAFQSFSEIACPLLCKKCVVLAPLSISHITDCFSLSTYLRYHKCYKAQFSWRAPLMCTPGILGRWVTRAVSLGSCLILTGRSSTVQPCSRVCQLPSQLLHVPRAWPDGEGTPAGIPHPWRGKHIPIKSSLLSQDEDTESLISFINCLQKF